MLQVNPHKNIIYKVANGVFGLQFYGGFSEIDIIAKEPAKIEWKFT